MTQTLAVIACLTSSLALAQTVPGSISFNARLTDTSGAPITGSHTLAFGLYTTGSGGAAVWTETISGAGFSTEGITFAELGASTPLTTAAIDGSKLYLEVSVDGTTMSPRLAVVAVPYAIRASIAATSLSVGSLVESAFSGGSLAPALQARPSAPSTRLAECSAKTLQGVAATSRQSALPLALGSPVAARRVMWPSACRPAPSANTCGALVRAGPAAATG